MHFKISKYGDDYVAILYGYKYFIYFEALLRDMPSTPSMPQYNLTKYTRHVN